MLSQENYDEFGGAEAHAAGFYNKEITLLLVLQSKTKDNDTELRNDTLRKLMEKLYRLFFAAAVFLYHFHCLRQKAEQKNDPEKSPLTIFWVIEDATEILIT